VFSNETFTSEITHENSITGFRKSGEACSILSPSLLSSDAENNEKLDNMASAWN
jgi:hypothetical protein